jgi:large-conductance mechanosensitive channel
MHSLRKTLEEFKSFVLRGSVLDLAVAFVVGAAFADVVKALVARARSSPSTTARFCMVTFSIT